MAPIVDETKTDLLLNKLFAISTYDRDFQMATVILSISRLYSGLLAAMRNLSPVRLRSDRAPFGSLLETFVLGELLKLASWSAERYDFFHVRDRYHNEVDIVIETKDGQGLASKSRLRLPSEAMTLPVCASVRKPVADVSRWGSCYTITTLGGARRSSTAGLRQNILIGSKQVL